MKDRDGLYSTISSGHGWRESRGTDRSPRLDRFSRACCHYRVGSLDQGATDNRITDPEREGRGPAADRSSWGILVSFIRVSGSQAEWSC
jgi:hypothetical protein